MSSDIKVESSATKEIKTLPATIYIYPDDIKAAITITPVGDCIKSNHTILRKELATSYWLNVFNVVGFFIDYSTGAMWQYPESIKIGVYRKDHCQEAG